MARGKSLCVYGTKGGIGKTIFTINLAGVLSNMHKKVLIIDLDLCNGGIAVSLNRDVNKTIYNFCDDYNNNRYENIGEYITKYNDYIDFISSPKDPRQENKIDSKYIDILLDVAIYKYDVVLIDTTHYFNEINIFTLDKVDQIIFMTTNNPLDLKNLKNFLNILKENDINKYKILLNDSVNPDKKYFSLYDIKNILNNNIDYFLSSKFYYKDIDSITINGDIVTINNPTCADYKVFELVIKSLLLKEGDQGE